MTRELSETKMGGVEQGIWSDPRMFSFSFPTFSSLLHDLCGSTCKLLAREGCWKLQCVPGLSMLHGPGLKPGSSPHLRLPSREYPGLMKVRGEGPEKATRVPCRLGAATLTSLSMSSSDPQRSSSRNQLHYSVCAARDSQLSWGPAKGALPL